MRVCAPIPHTRIMLFIRGKGKHTAPGSGPSSCRASRAGADASAAGASAAAASAAAASASFTASFATSIPSSLEPRIGPEDQNDPIFILSSYSNDSNCVTERLRDAIRARIERICGSRNASHIEAGIMSASLGSPSSYYRSFAIAMNLLHMQHSDERISLIKDWALAFVACVNDRSDQSQKLLSEALLAKAEIEQAAQGGTWRCTIPGCGSVNCTFMIVQTRSADEGGTPFTKCVKCGNVSRMR